jgi:hypothetical protein
MLSALLPARRRERRSDWVGVRLELRYRVEQQIIVQDHYRGGVELGQVSDESGAARVGPSERKVCAASFDGNLVDSLHFINDYAEENAFVLENDDMIMDPIRPWRLAKADGQVHHWHDVPAVIHYTNDVMGSLGNRCETWQSENFPHV